MSKRLQVLFEDEELDEIRLLLEAPELSARDALHLAVIERHEVPRILSFDAGFDGVAEVRRLY